MSEVVFVSGATGNIGSQVLKSLLSAGAKVRVDVRSKEKGTGFQKMGVEVVEMDLQNAGSIESALHGVEKAFSMSPLVPGIVEMGVNFAKAAKKAGVRYVVRSSGMGADALHPITLGKWHREAEKALENSGIPYTILRPNSFMQNYINFASQSIKNQNAFYFPQGDGKTSLVDVRDVGAVAAQLLLKGGHEGKAYTITGPTALSNHDIARIFSEVTGRTISYYDVPEEAARQAMKGLGVPDVIIESLLQLYAVNKAGHTADVTDTVEKITGKRATSFQQFAADFVGAFR